jgi:protein-tyrosine-phosphatase
VAAARALGFDVSDSRAQRATARHIEAADLIVVMDLSHLELMEREFPDALAKTTLLGLFSPDDPAEIRDPYDFGPAATRTVLEQIVRAVQGLSAHPAIAERVTRPGALEADIPPPRREPDEEAAPAATR